MGISHSRDNNIFATCGEFCQIWEETRSEPLKSLSWGADSMHHVAFNPVETNILSKLYSYFNLVLP